MFKAYRQSQAAQYRWIRKHPVQWIVLNAILTAVFVGFIEYYNRLAKRKLDDTSTQLKSV